MPDEPSGEQYRDTDGNPVSLNKLCRIEPDWAANVIRQLKAQISERDRRLSDIAKYTEGRGLYVEKQVKAVDSVIPIMLLLRREDAGDCWRLYRETLEAEHLPTPEEALTALGYDLT